MRLPILLALPFLAGPLAAQNRAIAPAPSALFRPAGVWADTAVHRSRISVVEGGGLGAGVGILLGAAFGAYQSSAHPCGCDDPGLEPFTFGFLGGVVGFVVGASIVDERHARPDGPSAPHVPEVGATGNEISLTSDPTRLIGKDPHGVRGGIAGALIGGVIGYALPHIAYSIQHSGGYADSGGGGDRGPSSLAVGVGTLSGALSGYLIGAMLSRR